MSTAIAICVRGNSFDSKNSNLHLQQQQQANQKQQTASQQASQQRHQQQQQRQKQQTSQQRKNAANHDQKHHKTIKEENLDKSKDAAIFGNQINKGYANQQYEQVKFIFLLAQYCEIVNGEFILN